MSISRCSRCSRSSRTSSRWTHSLLCSSSPPLLLLLRLTRLMVFSSLFSTRSNDDVPNLGLSFIATSLCLAYLVIMTAMMMISSADKQLSMWFGALTILFLLIVISALIEDSVNSSLHYYACVEALRDLNWPIAQPNG